MANLFTRNLFWKALHPGLRIAGAVRSCGKRSVCWRRWLGYSSWKKAHVGPRPTALRGIAAWPAGRTPETVICVTNPPGMPHCDKVLHEFNSFCTVE